jgi:hypothetical protein
VFDENIISQTCNGSTLITKKSGFDSTYQITTPNSSQCIKSSTSGNSGLLPLNTASTSQTIVPSTAPVSGFSRASNGTYNLTSTTPDACAVNGGDYCKDQPKPGNAFKTATEAACNGTNLDVNCSDVWNH